MDFDKYKNNMPYPTRPVKPFISHLKATAADHRKHADDLEVYEKKDAEYHEAKRAIVTESARLHELFREDAIEDVGLKGHPKAEKAFALAWEKGHSNGLSEVVLELKDIAELLLD